MGHLSVCEILLNHGADILALDNMGRSVLHHVTQAGQVCELIMFIEGKVFVGFSGLTSILSQNN